MKRFLLYLSALFLSVSFANAQTYSISKTTGTLNVGSGKGSVWTSKDCPIDLKMTANCEGNTVNAIEEIKASDAGLALYAGHKITDVNCFSVTYTVSIPENSGYKITAYSMEYSGYCANNVKVENEINSYSQTVSKYGAGTMAANGLDIYSFSFVVSDPESRNTSDDIDIQSFTVTIEQESTEEYTVSVIAGEGGTATVNGAAEATTTGKATLVAVPNYGYKFVNWTVGTEEVSTAAEYTATVDSDTEFVANFAKFENTDEWYAAIEKPSIGKAGNTTFVKAATLTGDVNVEATGIQDVAGQACVTNAIEVAAGAEFNLNITYQLNWGDLAIYQIDNDGATKEYGYYYGSWEPNGSTEKVAQNIADGGVSVTEVVDGACTATFPITINENHNPGDVIVVRAITGVTNNATNSAYEQGISEGGYVDFLFVVAEEEEPAFSHTLTVTEDGWATLFLGFNAEIPEGVEAYIVKEEGINDTYISLTQVEGVLPSNTGVIIKAPAGDYKFFYEETATADVTGNLLMGTLFNKNIEEEAYVLGNVDGVVGLYKAEMAGGVWLNNANKAYLPASAVPNKSAAFYGFDWNGTTGISEVKGESGNVKVIYDLTGRRVENPSNGIYIINGVKVLVK